MSGLVAVISEDAVPVSEHELEGLVRSYEELQGERGIVRAAAGGRVHAAVVGLETAASGTAGIEHGREGWLASVHSTRRPRLSDPARDLDGQFAVVRYDARADTAEVLSDPFGMQVLFVARRPGRTYVSTSGLTLARHLRLRPSALGLRVYLLAGSQFGARTLWEGVERLEPSTRMLIAPEGVRRETYWRLMPHDRFVGAPMKTVVDECVEVLLDSVRVDVAAVADAWCDITSGLDSRLLLVAARRAGATLDLSTSGEEGEPDVRIGRQLAQTVGMDWTFFPRFPGRWPDVALERLPAAVAWGEGSLDVVQLAAVLYRHGLKRQRHEATLTGGGGEHFRVYSSEQEFHRAGRTTRVNYDNWLNLRVLYPPVPVDVFASDPRPEVREDLRGRMEAWARPLAGYTNDVQLEALFVYKQMGHFGAYYSASRREIHAPLPFYRKAVVTAGLSASYAHKRGGRLERRMIERIDPQVAALPLQFGGVAAPMRPSNAHRFVPIYVRRGHKLVRKVGNLAGLWSARPAPAALPAVEARRAVLDRLTAHGERPLRTWQSAPLFDPAALERLVRDARDASFPHALLLGRIVTIELALRLVDAAM